MTTTQTREAARLYRMIADLMDEVVDLRYKYMAMCEDASNASARAHDLERELEHERARAERLDAEVGDWTRVCDARDAARERADAAEARVAELEASVSALSQSQNGGAPSNEARLINDVARALSLVAERIDLACDAEMRDLPYAEKTGFQAARKAALIAVEYLRWHPEEALAAGGDK